MISESALQHRLTVKVITATLNGRAADRITGAQKTP